MIECRVCKRLAERAPGASGRICRECNVQYMREYYSKHKTEQRAKEKARWRVRKLDPDYMAKNRKRGREYWQKLRHEAIMAYGGYRCVCCGETEPTFLSLDHVNNDGAEHRRSLGYSQNGKGAASQIWKWLRDRNYPSGFQVLCMNCNHSKARNGGICAHKKPAQSQYCVNSGNVSTRDNPEPSRYIGKTLAGRKVYLVGGIAEGVTTSRKT